ncbi:MAG: HEPN domain-containing protein [Candidatus Uhrbacteria bacterium]
MRDDFVEQIAYWKRSSAQDFKAAKSLFAKRLYPQCLFFCHLAVEKLLKGIVLKRTGEPAPYLHDLRRLAALARVTVSKDRAQELDEIFTFNIAGRYADAKLDFYRQHNRKAHAERFFVITERIIVWLNDEFRNES